MAGFNVNSGPVFSALLGAVGLVYSWNLVAADSESSSIQPASVEHVIIIESLEFSPAILEVGLGDTVVWINRDFVPHTASHVDGVWDTGSLSKDERYEIVVNADTPGEYFCRFHPGMVAGLVLRSD